MGTLVIYGGMLLAAVAAGLLLWAYTRSKRVRAGREEARGEAHEVD